MLPADTRPIGPQRVHRVLFSLPHLPGMGGSSGPSLAALSQQDWTVCPRSPLTAPCPAGPTRITPNSPDVAPPGSALIPRREGRYLHHLRISKEMRQKPSGVPGDGPRPLENVCVLPVKPHGRMGEAAQCWGQPSPPKLPRALVLSSLQQRGQGWGPRACEAPPGCGLCEGGGFPLPLGLGQGRERGEAGREEREGGRGGGENRMGSTTKAQNSESLTKDSCFPSPLCPMRPLPCRTLIAIEDRK